MMRRIPRHPRDEAPASRRHVLATCISDRHPRRVKLELHRFGDDARETGQVFIRQVEFSSTLLFEMIALTVNQCVTDGRMVDALRLSTLQDPAPLGFAIPAQSLQLRHRSEEAPASCVAGPVAYKRC